MGLPKKINPLLASPISLREEFGEPTGHLHTHEPVESYFTFTIRLSNKKGRRARLPFFRIAGWTGLFPSR